MKTVTAIMITGHRAERIPFARIAVDCFFKQRYEAKELLILNTGPSLQIDHPQVREVMLSQGGLTLGDLRNLALEEARSEYVIQWDDDDWYFRDRITAQMELADPEKACVLGEQIRYSFRSKRAFVAVIDGGIDGTILHRRDCGFRYPSLFKAEDTYFIRQFPERVVLGGKPHLYIRFFHGANTWDERKIMHRRGPRLGKWSRGLLLRRVLPTYHAAMGTRHEMGRRHDIVAPMGHINSATFTFYTTCRGRLHTLKQAYPEALELLAKRPNMNAVLLDYNSQDGLEEWVRENLRDFIASGLLTYYRTNQPDRFLHSHAKNVAARLCDGNFIGNLDADNHLTPEYLDRLETEFRLDDRIAAQGRKSACGRIVLRKDVFMAIGGYNELMCHGWGFEDADLVERAAIFGLRKVKLTRRCHIAALRHSNEERAADCSIRDINESRRLHFDISRDCIAKDGFTANVGTHWGRACLQKNFGELIEI